MTEDNIQEQSPPGMDVLQERHQNNLGPANSEADIIAAAQLFNAVGSELTKVQKHKVEGGVDAMQLDKNKVFRHEPAVTAEYPTGNQAAHPPTQEHVSSPMSQPPPVMNVAPTQSTVSISVKEYEQQKKTVTGIKRKLTKMEKQISDLGDIISHVSKNASYKVVTDDTEHKCNNTTTLLRHLAVELQSGVKHVTISKC